MGAVKTMETVQVNHVESIRPRYLVVMGVSGTGKTTIGVNLAEALHWAFQEGDSLHPQSNVEKMHAGVPLTDADRWPWLELCHEWLEKEVAIGRGAVLTCSALKKVYRDVLSRKLPVEFVHIKVAAEILLERMQQRTGHFMPPSLLPSQLATLEDPTDEEHVIRVSGLEPPDIILEKIIEVLQKNDTPRFD
ncbi:gluconokinase [Swingsia samuiensis]|uniref:Gluconokinase n=1 Tax=Swingsia samuiensis TaxID=1293412 RepID=A0A4Y6ULQ0_9PROT|nr:gluconokinase [Swingsia samuiensis]QDH17311.1 gluconokinase [Swingsia samuiensis]